MLRQAATDLYMRGAGRNVVLTWSSGNWQASFNALKQSVQVVQLLGKAGAPDVNQLVLKLRTRELTEPVEEASRHGEILH